MSIEYVYPESDRRYIFSYNELYLSYERFCAMSDAEFMSSLPDVLHFACIAAFIKEMGREVLSDEGVIHQLVHLMSITDEPLIDLRAVRRQFAEQLQIAR